MTTRRIGEGVRATESSLYTGGRVGSACEESERSESHWQGGWGGAGNGRGAIGAFMLRLLKPLYS